jgi:hypothetical protein
MIVAIRYCTSYHPLLIVAVEAFYTSRQTCAKWCGQGDMARIIRGPCSIHDTTRHLVS